MLASRRGFLTGRFRNPPAPQLRPPWALTAGAFEGRCDACGDCIAACPSGILRMGVDGLAAVDFSAGECTFCGECARVCKPAALVRSAENADRPWMQHISIGAVCLAKRNIECRVCGESCDVGAIRFRPRQGGAALPQIEVDRCNGCGGCIAPCPANAIVMEKQQW